MFRYLVDLLNPGNRSSSGLMAKGAGGTFIMKAVNTGLGFVTAILLARALGVKGYGIYAYVISWITLLGVFARLGLDQTINRYVAVYYQQGDWSRIYGLLRFSFIVVAVSAMICLLLAGSVTWIYYRDFMEMRNALWVSFLILPITALMVPCSSTQFGLQQVIQAQVPFLLVQPVGFMLFVYGAWLLFPGELTPILVLSLSVVTTCLSLVLAAWLLKRALMSAFDGVSLSTIKPTYDVSAWIHSAIPVTLMGGMFLANANADILMLGVMVGPEAAAVYKAATRGADFVAFGLIIILAPLAPLITKLYISKELEQLKSLISRSAKSVFLFSVMTACFLFIFGKQFLSLFGHEFVLGEMALNILIVGQLVNSAAGISGTILVMCGLEKKAAAGLFVGVCINILLNLMFIPLWGINGAAIATSVSTVMWVFMQAYWVFKCLHINPTCFSFIK